MKNSNLHNLAPGFTSPKDYFDNIESQIMDRVSLSTKVSSRNAFKVPENYFEELDSRILDNTLASARKESKVFSIFRNTTLRYAASVAAILLIFISIFQFQKAQDFKNISTAHISSYIDSGYLDYSDIDFEALLTDEMLDDVSLFSSLSQDELFDYLSYDVDESQLIND